MIPALLRFSLHPIYSAARWNLAALPPFRLTKWYLDCVSDTGDAAIVYAARVEWRKLRLNYSSLLSRISGTITTRTSMTRLSPQPASQDRCWLDAPRLELTGEWRGIDPPIAQTFLQTDKGSVRWDCVQPRSHARIVIGDHIVEGLGYAERLSLTIPPWQLPLQRLQWGRWLSKDSSIVWVDWEGTHSGQWVWQNSVPIDASQVAPDQIDFGSGQKLHFDRAFPLRAGRVDRTVLPAASSLARVFPRSMFGIKETKWLSGGEFIAEKKQPSGWAIHEVVEWNQ